MSCQRSPEFDRLPRSAQSHVKELGARQLRDLADEINARATEVEQRVDACELASGQTVPVHLLSGRDVVVSALVPRSCVNSSWELLRNVRIPSGAVPPRTKLTAFQVGERRVELLRQEAAHSFVSNDSVRLLATSMKADHRASDVEAVALP